MLLSCVDASKYLMVDADRAYYLSSSFAISCSASSKYHSSGFCSCRGCPSLRPITRKLRASSVNVNGSPKIVKGKSNVWSVDNDRAKEEKEKEKLIIKTSLLRKVEKRRRECKGLVSGRMYTDIVSITKPQEPIPPATWDVFAKTIRGFWNGVGAAFSPIGGEMAPIEVSEKGVQLYECYTVSSIGVVPTCSADQVSQIKWKMNRVYFNTYGESRRKGKGHNIWKEKKKGRHGCEENNVLPKFESFDFRGKYPMEEKIMADDPGFIFFMDGSYSKGPTDIPVGFYDVSEYHLNPTFHFEQCLVKGPGKRVRIVHTLSFDEGGGEVNVLRADVFEENMSSGSSSIGQRSEEGNEMKPYSRRKRTREEEMAGMWRVTEVSVTPMREGVMERGGVTGHIYYTTEMVKKRGYARTAVYFEDKGNAMGVTEDVTVVWLRGGLTAYVDVNTDNKVLCIGFGCCCGDGLNLGIERYYAQDGRLIDIRLKSELRLS